MRRKCTSLMGQLIEMKLNAVLKTALRAIWIHYHCQLFHLTEPVAQVKPEKCMTGFHFAHIKEYRMRIFTLLTVLVVFAFAALFKITDPIPFKF